MAGIFTFAAVLATLILGPQTPLGRALERMVVQPLAMRLVKVGRGHLLVVCGLVLFVAAVFAVLGQEGAVFLQFSMPEVAGWLSLFDAAALADAVVATLLIAASARVAAVRLPRFRLGQAVRAPRRARRASPRGRNDNDDSGPRRLAA